ncbi:MAG: dTDP-4-dehydrorhamnose reductase [Halobacteriota archaeon]
MEAVAVAPPFWRTMTRVLITGGSGLLGRALQREASKYKIEALGTYHRASHERGIPLDITNREHVSATIQRLKPDWIIHAAAMTDVDRCERERDKAWQANALGTKNVVDAGRESGARMIYISTDFVFDGEHGPYAEEDATHPINVYGESKLAGERFVLAEPDNAVARVCVLYGSDKPNFVTWVVESLRVGTPVNVVNDQYNTPTYTNNCAQALLGLCERHLTGIYHVSGREQLSRYDFACAIADVFGLDGKLINVASTDMLRQQARRPKNSALRVDKAERALGMRLADVHEGLCALRDEWR